MDGDRYDQRPPRTSRRCQPHRLPDARPESDARVLYQSARMSPCGALRSPGIRSTSGEESGPFLHVFYETENGECLAFFALEGRYERRDDGLPSFTRHLALGVKDAADLERWQQELATQGVEVSPAIDHDGIWQSIYVWDPNGIRLELTFQNRPLGPADAAEGAVELENWLTEHSGTEQLSH